MLTYLLFADLIFSFSFTQSNRRFYVRGKWIEHDDEEVLVLSVNLDGTRILTDSKAVPFSNLVSHRADINFISMITGENITDIERANINDWRLGVEVA